MVLLLLLWCLLVGEGVVRLSIHASRSSRSRHLSAIVDCGHARELLSKEGVVASSLSVDAGNSCTGTVDERARGCVLGGNTKVACVAKGVHAVTARKQSVESCLVLIHLLLRSDE